MCSPTTTSADPALPNWTPDGFSSFGSLQSTPIVIFGGSFLLPDGWRLLGSQDGLNNQQSEFTGSDPFEIKYGWPPMPHALYAHLSVDSVADAMIIDDSWTIETGLEAGVSDVETGLRNVTVTPIEHGLVGGLPAVRRFVSGDRLLDPGEDPGNPVTGESWVHVAPEHGVVYVIGDDAQHAEFEAWDYGSRAQETLGDLQQGILHFQESELPAALRQPRTPTGWKPDPAVAKYVISAKPVGPIVIYPPSLDGENGTTWEADADPSSTSPQTKGYTWRIEAGDMGPTLYATVTDLAPGAAPPALSALLSDFVKSRTADLQNTTIATVEYGDSGYGHTARTRVFGLWQKGQQSLPKVMAFYAFVTPTSTVCLEGSAYGTHDYRWLPILENSILTGHVASAAELAAAAKANTATPSGPPHPKDTPMPPWAGGM